MLSEPSPVPTVCFQLWADAFPFAQHAVRQLPVAWRSGAAHQIHLPVLKGELHGSRWDAQVQHQQMSGLLEPLQQLIRPSQSCSRLPQDRSAPKTHFWWGGLGTAPASSCALQVELFGPRAGASTPPWSAEPSGARESWLHGRSGVSGVSGSQRERNSAPWRGSSSGGLRLCHKVKVSRKSSGKKLTGEVPEPECKFMNYVEFFFFFLWSRRDDICCFPEKKASCTDIVVNAGDL